MKIGDIIILLLTMILCAFVVYSSNSFSIIPSTKMDRSTRPDGATNHIPNIPEISLDAASDTPPDSDTPACLRALNEKIRKKLVTGDAIKQELRKCAKIAKIPEQCPGRQIATPLEMLRSCAQTSEMGVCDRKLVEADFHDVVQVLSVYPHTIAFFDTGEYKLDQKSTERIMNFLRLNLSTTGSKEESARRALFSFVAASPTGSSIRNRTLTKKRLKTTSRLIYDGIIRFGNNYDQHWRNNIGWESLPESWCTHLPPSGLRLECMQRPPPNSSRQVTIIAVLPLECMPE